MNNNDITTRVFWEEQPLPLSIEELEKVSFDQRRMIFGFQPLPPTTFVREVIQFPYKHPKSFKHKEK